MIINSDIKDSKIPFASFEEKHEKPLSPSISLFNEPLPTLDEEFELPMKQELTNENQNVDVVEDSKLKVKKLKRKIIFKVCSLLLFIYGLFKTKLMEVNNILSLKLK